MVLIIHLDLFEESGDIYCIKLETAVARNDMKR